MKRIALLGATGKSGRPFLKLALEKGYEVHALVRNPKKLPLEAGRLKVFQGDILNEADVRKTIEGADAVINLTGHVKGSPPDLQTQCIRHVISAMKSHKIKRIITLTGSGVPDRDHDGFSLIDRVVSFGMQNLAGRAIRQRFSDGMNYARLLREEKDLDWTIVRAPVLNQLPARGRYKVAYVGKVGGYFLSREDLANFILKEMETGQYIRKMPFITN